MIAALYVTAGVLIGAAEFDLAVLVLCAVTLTVSLMIYAIANSGRFPKAEQLFLLPHVTALSAAILGVGLLQYVIQPRGVATALVGAILAVLAIAIQAASRRGRAVHISSGPLFAAAAATMLGGLVGALLKFL